MARGGAVQSKVHFKGKSDDFLVFVDDVEAYKKWLSDKSVPLVEFVSTFSIYLTHNQGVTGTYDTASKSSLDNEFGTHVDTDVITKILEKGTLQESQFAERQGFRNDSNGPLIAN
ncbi:SDO1-like protein C21C3.19 [Naviculisporaceae sp. PSN 640]